MRNFPSALAPAGYSPARLNPLSPAPVADQGQRLTDLIAIQKMFANGEKGGYWPADPAYLFEDSAGTIPASVNGVVGMSLGVGKNTDTTNLQLDSWVNGYSTPLGSFSSSASSVLSGTLPASGGSRNIVGNISSVVGKLVMIRFSIATTGVSSCSINFSSGAYSGLTGGATASVNGVFSMLFVVPLNAVNVLLLYSGESGAQVSVTNFIVRSFSTYSAIQATTANKPYLRRTPVSNKFWLDSNTTTGALTATFASSLGSACTIATVGAEGVTIAENQTVGTTYNLTPPYGYNGDVLIINRALTAAEKALVTRVMGWNVPTLGSELVVNGSFDNSNAWTVGSSSTGIENGVATITNLPGNAYVRQDKSYFWSIGEQIYLTYIITSQTGNAPNFIETSGTGGLMYFADTGQGGVGTKKFARFTTNRSTYLSFMTAGTISRSFVIDNVSAKAIL